MTTQLKAITGFLFLTGISLLIPFTLSYANDTLKTSDLKTVDVAVEESKTTSSKTQVNDTTIDKENIVYGWELMSDPERNEYETKVKSLSTDVEVEKFQAEHYNKMQERAKIKGIILPE